MNNTSPTLHPIARISSFLATLQPSSLALLGDHYTERIHFLDPIHEGQGLEELRTIIKEHFKQWQNSEFDITDSRGDEQAAFLKWVLRYQVRGKEREFPGVSYLIFAKDGRVASQQNYWDTAAGVYSDVPGLSMTLRSVKKSMQVRP